MGSDDEITNVNSDDENDKDFDYESYKEKFDSDNSTDSQEVDSNAEKKKKVDSKKVQEEETGPILPEGHRFDKKFVCIRYPGKVINPEKAVETLGGLSSISTAVDAPNRRLELRFRPSDGYCKPACGDRHQVSGFLLRIRVKKSRVQQVNELSKAEEAENYRHLVSAMPNSKNNLDETNNTDNNTTTGLNNSKVPENMTNRIYSENNDDIKRDKASKNQSFSQQSQKTTIPNFDRQKYEDLADNKNYQLPKLKVLGRIATEFRFSGLCDFQYLPITRNFSNSNKNECVHELIHPIGILPYKWLDNKVPYFLPPAVFSRMDNVQQYSLKTESKETGPDNVIGKTRKRRAGFSSFINFNALDIPLVPPKGIEVAMRVKFLNSSHFQLIQSLFEERPIWSKTALIYKTNFTNEQLKILLPSVAYYFITGPWRIMWVKLGYDPRKDPSARIYQTLDYRIKAMHGLEQTVKGKRAYSNYILPYKSASMSKPKTAVLTNLTDNETQQTKKEKTPTFTDNVYIYREGTIPPSRQMFYQYCDVYADEIQEMLAKLPDPQPGTKCHEKRGWLPCGFSDHCREVINKQVKTVLRKKHNIPEDHPTTLPRVRVSRKTLTARPHMKRRKIVEKLMKSKQNESQLEKQVVCKVESDTTEQLDNENE